MPTITEDVAIMAAIMSSGGSAGSAAPVAVKGTAAASSSQASASQTSASQGSAGDLSDLFTQLIAAMGAPNASTQQTPVPASPDLAAFEGTEAFDLFGDDRDSDDLGDDEEAGALAVAALLTGLTPPATTMPATASSAQGGRTDAIEGAFITRGSDIDVTQAAIDALTGEGDNGTGDTAADAAPAPATPNTQNTSPHPQMHSMLNSHAAQAADAVPDGTLEAPVGSRAWKDELGTQLTWMAINGRDAASLRMSPEHLGPVEVRVSVREGEASVYFSASNTDTRSALEQSLPRLRELFASQGLVLTDAGVSRDAPRNAFKPTTPSSGSRGNSDAPAEVAVKSVTLARAGLIDTYV